MPIYDSIKTYRAGFYDNKKTNGVNDRVYTAKDIRRPYDTVFSDGIKPDFDGSAGSNLEVSAVEGMKIAVSPGHAKLGGAWFWNEKPYGIILDAAIAVTRYDCVIIRNDDSADVRDPMIYIKSLFHKPTVSDLTRTDEIYELCVAYIVVDTSVNNILTSSIVDTRMDGELCFTMTGAGGVVTRTYRNTYFTKSENQSVIPIGISQFERNRDKLTVSIEGRICSYTAYAVNNDSVTLSLPLPVVGTRVDFEVVKNVNGKAGADATGEYLNLIADVQTTKNKLEHHYYCNGASDNIEISKIAQDWIRGGLDYSSIRLIIHGNLGVSVPYSGEGTYNSNYFWFALGKDGENTNRRLVVDFTDCNAANIPIEAGTYNTVFSGNDVNIVGANVIANQSAVGTYIRMFSSSAGAVFAENCRFWITAYLTSYISQTGTFINCRGSVTCHGSLACCFHPTANSLLRVQGGEYYAYTTSSYTSAVVYQTADTAVAILNGMSCPTFARSGFVQSNAVNATGTYIRIADIVTTLPITAPNGEVTGTIKISKAGML